MTKKVLILGVALIMCLGIFSGCGNNKYNAVVLNEGYSFKSEFLKENRTLGARYLNENWNEESDEWNDRYLIDETSPEFRVFIVKKQGELNNIFDSFPQVDFNREMVLVYCYTEIYSRPHLINAVSLDGMTLEVEFSLKKSKSGINDATMPSCRLLIIKMNILEIDTVKFIKK